MDEKIAIITDSCSDLTPEFAKENGIFIIPLTIIYPGQTYRDRIEITPNEVYDRMPEEVPTTSLPLPGDVEAVFKDIVAAGYTHVIAVTVSSNLSGTTNLIQNIAGMFIDTLDTAVIDSRNASLSEGAAVIFALDLLAQGRSYSEIVYRTTHVLRHTVSFLCVNTLEYMYRGGRISKNALSIGSALDLQPILTVDPEGKVKRAMNARGRKQSIKRAIKLAKKAAAASQKYRVFLINGGAAEEASALESTLAEEFPYAIEMLSAQVSPVIGVHTGPGLIGIGVQVLDGPEEKRYSQS